MLVLLIELVVSPLWPAMASSRAKKGWNAKWTDITEEGTCESCGEKLQGIGLSPEDRTRMRSSIVRIAAQNGAGEVRRVLLHVRPKRLFVYIRRWECRRVFRSSWNTKCFKEVFIYINIFFHMYHRVYRCLFVFASSAEGINSLLLVCCLCVF